METSMRWGRAWINEVWVFSKQWDNYLVRYTRGPSWAVAGWRCWEAAGGWVWWRLLRCQRLWLRFVWGTEELQGNESNTGRAAGSLAAYYGHAVLLLVLAVLDCNSWELSVGRRCWCPCWFFCLFVFSLLFWYAFVHGCMLMITTNPCLEDWSVIERGRI